MKRTLFRNALLVTMDPVHGGVPLRGDLLVEGTKIVSVGPSVGPTPDMEVIEAGGRLIMPGLVNAHTHSSETFFRGRYQKMPLEVWLLYAYPFLMGDPIGLRLLYLRSLLLAMESLRGGVTTICDDFFDPPRHELDRLASVFRAYDDAGIRANVSNGVMNVPALDALPFARAIVPLELQAQLDAPQPISPADYLAFCQAAFASLHQPAGRLRFMVAPSAPQRCTPDLLLACSELAQREHVPFHIHVLETKTQAVTGGEVYGRSLVRYMADLGVLTRNTTIAHSVWVSDADMALMGEAGCAVAHNAVSNLKLGAGVAPVRRLLDAGVAIGLGTDGVSSNDSARIFDVMRVAALVQSASGPDAAEWLSAQEILHAATLGGARTAMLDGVTGSLQAGKAADLLVLDLDAYAFTPLNDPVQHLVFAENGSSIDMVMVDGEMVLRGGKLTRVDEAAILAEIRELVPALLAEHTELEQRNAVFEPYFAEIHRRASLVDIGLNRYAGDLPFWRGRN